MYFGILRCLFNDTVNGWCCIGSLVCVALVCSIGVQHWCAALVCSIGV